MSNGKCVKCGSSDLTESINARIRGGVQMISCKQCGFVEFYMPNDKEKSNNLKDGLKHTALVFIIGIGFVLTLAVLSSLWLQRLAVDRILATNWIATVTAITMFQSQQLFSRASCAQKHVFAGTISALELLSLNRVVTFSSSPEVSPFASRHSFSPNSPHMLSFHNLMSAR